MDYVIMDMEWNQPMPGRDKTAHPVPLTGEVIQIGAVKLDSDLCKVDTFKIGISPKYYKKMNYMVRKITRITDADLKKGVSFPQAMEAFRRWCGEDYVFVTWGADDIPLLRENLRIWKMDEEWLPTVYNLQIIFDMQVAQEHQPCSLVRATEKIGRQGMTAHDALHDAVNTAQICQCLDMEKGVAEYAEDYFKQASLRSEDFAAICKTRAGALRSSKVCEFECPDCRQKVRCGRWLDQSAEKHIALADCPGGERFFVRVKLVKLPDGRYGTKRTVYPLDENRLAYYEAKVAARRAGKKARRPGHARRPAKKAEPAPQA